MVDFRIDVIVDPAKAKPGVDQVGKRLDSLEKEATQLRQELQRALSVRDSGAAAAFAKVEGQAKSAQETTRKLTEDQRRLAAAVRRQQEVENQRLALFRAQAKERIDRENQIASAREKSLGRLRNLSVGLFGAFSTALAVREFARLADAATLVRNRLKIVTESEQELISVQNELFDIANRTRSSFEGTATIFTRLANVQDQLGVSQSTLLTFTERLNQAIILSGASAEESRAGLIQLSQGLASGTLRGDELRSVLEQLPAVAKIIAESLGVTIGQLRTLGAEGKITSDIIIDALVGAGAELDAAFAETVPTIGQSFQVLGNNVLEAVGAFDQATGVSRLFAQGVILAAENVEVLASAVLVLSGALLVKLASTAIPAAITGLVGLKVATLAAVPAVGAAVAAVTVFASKLQGLKKEIEEIEEATRQLELDTAFGDERFRSITRAQREINNINRAIEAQRRRGAEASESQIARIRQLEQAIRALRGEAQAEAELQKRVAAVRAANSQAVTDVIAKLKEEGEALRLTSEERMVQEELEKRVAELKKQNINLDDENLAKIKENIEALIRSNTETERQQRLLDRIRGPGEQYKKILEDLQVLLDSNRINQEQFNKAVEDFKPKELRAEGDPFAKQVQSLREANEELQIRADNQGFFEELLIEQVRLEREVGELSLLQKLELAGQVAQKQILLGQLARQKKEEQEIAKAQREAQAEQDRQERRTESLIRQVNVMESLKQQEAELNALRGDARVNVEALDQAIADVQLRQLDASNELAAGFERAFARIQREAMNLAAVGEDIVNVFADRATEALVEFARTGQFSFKEFANAILEDIIRIIARLLIVQALSAAIGGGGAILGTAVSGVATNQGRQRGGTVQPGQAPVPVGENGPELLVPNQTATIVPNARDVAAAPPQVNVQVVNVKSEDEVPEAIASGNATEAIIQQLGENKDRVNQVLR